MQSEAFWAACSGTAQCCSSAEHAEISALIPVTVNLRPLPRRERVEPVLCGRLCPAHPAAIPLLPLIVRVILSQPWGCRAGHAQFTSLAKLWTYLQRKCHQVEENFPVLSRVVLGPGLPVVPLRQLTPRLRADPVPGLSVVGPCRQPGPRPATAPFSKECLKHWGVHMENRT